MIHDIELVKKILRSLKNRSVRSIASEVGLTEQAIYYYKSKYNIYKPADIDRAIKLVDLQANEFQFRDYERQALCDHQSFTIFLKCSCSLVLSENHLDQIIEICKKKKESLRSGKLHEQVL